MRTSPSKVLVPVVMFAIWWAVERITRPLGSVIRENPDNVGYETADERMLSIMPSDEWAEIERKALS